MYSTKVIYCTKTESQVIYLMLKAMGDDFDFIKGNGHAYKSHKEMHNAYLRMDAKLYAKTREIMDSQNFSACPKYNGSHEYLLLKETNDKDDCIVTLVSWKCAYCVRTKCSYKDYWMKCKQFVYMDDKKKEYIIDKLSKVYKDIGLGNIICFIMEKNIARAFRRSINLDVGIWGYHGLDDDVDCPGFGRCDGRCGCCSYRAFDMEAIISHTLAVAISIRDLRVLIMI